MLIVCKCRILTFKNLPKKAIKKVSETKVIFNTNKKEGWNTYKHLTTNNRVFEGDILLENDDPDKMMNQISREMVKCKYRAFGKVQTRKRKMENASIVDLMKKKDEVGADLPGKPLVNEDIDEEIACKVREQQCKILEKEINELKNIRENKGNTAAIYTLKKKMVGPKKTEQVPTVVIDPASKKEETDPKRIKEVSVKYVKDLLTNRNPTKGYEEDLEMKRKIHESRMIEYVPDKEKELSREAFEDTWKTLCKTKKEKYKFVMNAGPGLKEALFALYKLVWKTERCPLLWDKTKIIQVYKSSGQVEDLANYRNLHIKEEIGKMFSHIVVNKIKEKVSRNMGEFQSSKPGHRPQENLYILKSLMSLKEKYKEPLILQLMDLEKFFHLRFL